MTRTLVAVALCIGVSSVVSILVTYALASCCCPDCEDFRRDLGRP